MSKSIQFKNGTENYYVHPYFPIGSIYLSVVDTNPSQWFGGTWELIAQGRTLVGVDINQTEFNTVKKTGGEKTVTLTTSQIPSHTHTFTGKSHTHTYDKSNRASGSHALTLTEIPSHNHICKTVGRGTFHANNDLPCPIDYSRTDNNGTYHTSSTGGGSDGKAVGHIHSIDTTSTNTGGTTQGGTNSNTGGGGSHNNLQPYFTCYIWCRTK